MSTMNNGETITANWQLIMDAATHVPVLRTLTTDSMNF